MFYIMARKNLQPSFMQEPQKYSCSQGGKATLAGQPGPPDCPLLCLPQALWPSCPARGVAPCAEKLRERFTRTGRLYESRSDSPSTCHWKNQAEFKAEMPRVV